MNNSDYRVRYTKMMLQQALMEALHKKSINQVTVTELCEAAKINRGTFYLHYATPNDVLMEVEQQFIDENMNYFSPYMQQDEKEINQLAGMFTCILKNREICRIIMGKHGNPRFLDRLQEMIREDVIAEWRKEFPLYQKEDLDYVFDYIFSGSMKLILNWLEDEKKLSVTELANRLDRLGHYSHLAISEFSHEKKTK